MFVPNYKWINLIIRNNGHDLWHHHHLWDAPSNHTNQNKLKIISKLYTHIGIMKMFANNTKCEINVILMQLDCIFNLCGCQLSFVLKCLTFSKWDFQRLTTILCNSQIIYKLCVLQDSWPNGKMKNHWRTVANHEHQTHTNKTKTDKTSNFVANTKFASLLYFLIKGNNFWFEFILMWWRLWQMKNVRYLFFVCHFVGILCYVNISDGIL